MTIDRLEIEDPHFEYLPAFANYLHQHIDEHTKDVIQLSYEVEVPLLKHLNHFSKEEIFELSKGSNLEILSFISQNKVGDYIKQSNERWLSNQLQIVGKLDVQAEDITLINYVRGKVFKKAIISYTKDPDLIYNLWNEVDDYFLALNTASINSYIQILKERIEEESNFSSNIIQASPGIIFIYDLVELKEVYLSGRVEELTGYAATDLLSINNMVTQLAHPEDQPRIFGFFQQALEDKERLNYQSDYRFKHKDGNYIWLRFYASVYKRDQEGKANQIIGAAYDVTNEKETAIELERREKQLLEAQSIGKTGSYEWDVVNDTSIITPEMYKILEFDKRQTLEEMMEKVHPDDKEKVRAALAEAFVSGDYKCEYRYRAGSGEKVLDSRGIVSFDENKKPLSVVGTVQDITERKKIEESLLQNTLELQRSNLQLQEFAYVASHDMKEPLRKISVFTNIIMTSDWQQLSEKTQENIEKIADAAQRMKKLIDEILSFSSFHEGSPCETCNLEVILKEATTTLEHAIKEKNATVTSDGLPEASVIPFQIQQLFQNLISNALKFAKKDEAPVIIITHKFFTADNTYMPLLEPGKKYLQLEFKDNGIGFNQEWSEKIFGLFQRLHNKTAYEGSGLGLAICRKIVENHSGIIKAASKEGVGATFTIFLPL